MSATSHWIFAYGSLMWRPDFKFIRASRARLEGYHRSLCHYSHHYRGSPEKPGLVFALDVGGYCEGLAYEVADTDWPEVHALLTARELVNHTYEEVFKSVTLEDGNKVTAMCYVMDRNHKQYAKDIDQASIVTCVRQGEGTYGKSIDYVRATHKKLVELGIDDKALNAIVAAL